MTVPQSDGERAAAFRFGPIARGARAVVARTLGAPLYVQIVVALVLGVIVGVWLGPDAAGLMLPGQLVLRLLGALALPLILCAIVHALINAQFGKGVSLRLVGLLLLNTLVAITIGLLVANLLRPGAGAELRPPEPAVEVRPKADPLTTFLDNVPRSVLGPLTDDGKVLGVIILALAFGLALRHERERKVATPGDLVELLLACLVRILHWVITLVPLAVFGIIASIVGTQGFAPFRSLGFFIVSVLLALRYLQQDVPQCGNFERLQQVMIEAGVARALPIFFGPEPCQRDAHHVLRVDELAQTTANFVTAHARHPDIDKRRLRPKLFRDVQSRRPIICGTGLVAQQVEQHAQALGRIPIVVDHKDPQAAACRRGFVTVGSGGGPKLWHLG